MIVYNVNEKDIRLYSLGKQKAYYGTAIEYFDNKISFIFLYFQKYCICYVVNGMEKKEQILQVDGKVNIIVKFRDKECRRLSNLVKDFTIKDKDKIFDLSPAFYLDLKCIINSKTYKSTALNLYNKYKRELLLWK